jgi:hypothetical protein
MSSKCIKNKTVLYTPPRTCRKTRLQEGNKAQMGNQGFESVISGGIYVRNDTVIASCGEQAQCKLKKAPFLTA